MGNAENTEIIIIGAGAAGLAAARLLLNKGKQVIILEASSRIGGRVLTEKLKGFTGPLEMGAEFIHGKAPKTFSLLKKYNISYTKVKGAIWKHDGKEFNRQRSFIEDGHQLTKHLRKIEKDKTVEQFLQQDLKNKKFESLRKDVKQFVEGFDTADIHTASVMTLKEEWKSMRHAKQYRVDGGYSGLIVALAGECREKGGLILTRKVVETIRHSAKGVEIITQNKEKYTADKVIVTVPVYLLKSGKEKKRSIEFIPRISSEQNQFIKNIGFGHIIKIFLQFNENIWEKNKSGSPLRKTGFLISDEKVPTWWTRFPQAKGMITGWLAAEEFAHKNKRVILQTALSSLSIILEIPQTVLLKKLKTWKIIDWSEQIFTGGSYTFETTDSRKLRSESGIMKNGNVYFAGEAFYNDGSGTVEAALGSGEQAAKKILRL
jgi:monoamine oxidase